MYLSQYIMTTKQNCDQWLANKLKSIQETKLDIYLLQWTTTQNLQSIIEILVSLKLNHNFTVEAWNYVTIIITCFITQIIVLSNIKIPIQRETKQQKQDNMQSVVFI